MLSGIEFEKKGEGNLINLDFEEGLKIIKIDASTLYILYSKEDENWAAELKR